MAIIVTYQGDAPLPTTIPVTVGGVAYALNSSNGVSGVAAMLSANGVDQWGTWRTCTIVGDGSSGQVQVPWLASDFAASGSYVLYVRVYWNAGVNWQTLPPDVVQIPARQINNAPPQPLGATPAPDATLHNLTITGTVSGLAATPVIPGLMRQGWADPRDGGARWDGTTDDSAAVQTVLTQAVTAGVPFRFPKGMGRASGIIVPQGAIIEGWDAGSYPAASGSLPIASVVARPAGVNTHVFTLPDGANYCRIRNLAIDGNKNNNTAGSGIYIADGAAGQESQTYIEHCYVQSNPGDNIYLGHNRRANKVLWSILNYSGNGSGVAVAGSDNTIKGCIAGTNAQAGIRAGTTPTQNNVAYASPFATTVLHIENCDLYGNETGVAIAQSSAGVLLINGGIDRNLKQGVTVYDGFSNTISGVYFHTNGQAADNTYAHIDLGPNVGQVAIAHCNFGPLDGGYTNRATYGITVQAPGVTKVLGGGNTLDATSTASGLTNAQANAPSAIYASTSGLSVQGNGADILNLKNSSGTTVAKLTNGGSLVLPGTALQVGATAVVGALTALANTLTSLISTATGTTVLALQRKAGQTAPYLSLLDSDGVTVLGSVDANARLSLPSLSAAGLTGATAASRYVGATASGAPASGTFLVGDFVIDQSGKVWICTAAGTPGTWAQVAGGNGTSGVPAFFKSGLYYGAAISNTSGALAAFGTLRVAPLAIPAGGTAAAIGVNVTGAGDAGSVIRLVLYNDAGGYPGTLLLDAGTVSGTAVAYAEAVISQALAAGVYWIGAVAQGGTVTTPSVSLLNGSEAFIGASTGSAAATGFNFGYSMGGVTGAAPGTFSATVTASGSVPKVVLKAQ